MFDTISCKPMDKSPMFDKKIMQGSDKSPIFDCSHCNYLMASVKDSNLRLSIKPPLRTELIITVGHRLYGHQWFKKI